MADTYRKDPEAISRLTPEQHQVTQEKGTEPASFLGDPEEKTLKLYVEELNRRGGVNGNTLKLIVYDDGGDADKARTFATRLVEDDKVSAVLGGSTRHPGFSATLHLICPADGHQDRATGHHAERAPNGSDGPGVSTDRDDARFRGRGEQFIYGIH